MTTLADTKVRASCPGVNTTRAQGMTAFGTFLPCEARRQIVRLVGVDRPCPVVATGGEQSQIAYMA